MLYKEHVVSTYIEVFGIGGAYYFDKFYERVTLIKKVSIKFPKLT